MKKHEVEEIIKEEKEEIDEDEEVGKKNTESNLENK